MSNTGKEQIKEYYTIEAAVNEITDAVWPYGDYCEIADALKIYGLEQIKGRDEYILFRQIVRVRGGEEILPSVTEHQSFGNAELTKKPVKSGGFEEVSIPHLGTPKEEMTPQGGVSSAPPAAWTAESLRDAFGRASLSMLSAAPKVKYVKPFMAPLDVQHAGSISDEIDSFRVIQSERMSLNIGFDTEFQDFRNRDSASDAPQNRRVLSLQMSINIGDFLIRYFFLVDPRFQEITAEEGGKVPLKYCLADILDDLKKNCFPDFPLVLKKNIVYREKKGKGKGNDPFKVIDTAAIKDFIIPVTLICHTGKADISVFRRSKYDVDLLRKLSEIQRGWMTTEDVYFKAENDPHYNYYWILDLCVRDTLGLTPAENKSLKALGRVIGRPKITLPPNVIEHMSSYAVTNPVEYYEYAMNDADIVVLFCSELFRCNHAVPLTLSSAAASAMRDSIKEYLCVHNKADYDRKYRGLEMLDEGIVPSKDECLKFLRATRYVPIRENPDAKLISEYFEEAYTGGFNASFYIGWITDKTIDFDLQNAYPTAMANIIDIDWQAKARDLPRNEDLRLQDLSFSPLVPAVAVGDVDFPDDCYCPNIPVAVKGGMKIYPRHVENAYMTGPDMYLALMLGARIKIFRGFICEMLTTREGKASMCLAYAVANLVQDRMLAKQLYKDNPLIEKSLKTMVNSCYGKTAQNVSPKTRYSAKIMGRVDSEPSSVTSPYHAAYTTALVRCMLIACINQLHDMGYRVYSVTTDGFITDAPTDVIRGLDAYGFAKIFQMGRYTLNQTKEPCEANQVWEPKHFNDTFLNFTTRGNVAVNDEGVLAHNSYTTGEVKDSRADREAYIIAVLTREGRLKCPTKVWTEFSEIVERRHDFKVTEILRQLKMNFDYKRCPIVETAVDTPVHYEATNGQVVDTVIAEFDTRPFQNAEEFLNYRTTMKSEDCVKVKADLERVKVKSTAEVKGYIGKDLDRKILLSILMGYRSGLYSIPALDRLKQAEIVATVNSWGVSKISVNDWKNCSRKKRQENKLPRELVEETLQKILAISAVGDTTPEEKQNETT